MLQVLAWWAVPLGALGLAGAWAAWRGRAPRPLAPHRSVARWRRGSQALARAQEAARSASPGSAAASPPARTGRRSAR